MCKVSQGIAIFGLTSNGFILLSYRLFTELERGCYLFFSFKRLFFFYVCGPLLYQTIIVRLCSSSEGTGVARFKIAQVANDRLSRAGPASVRHLEARRSFRLAFYWHFSLELLRRIGLVLRELLHSHVDLTRARWHGWSPSTLMLNSINFSLRLGLEFLRPVSTDSVLM